MPSLIRGEAATDTNPVLDLYIESPRGLAADVAVLEFRILDISDAAKRAAPVQVYPVVDPELAPTYVSLDPTLSPDDNGHRLGVGHYYAPWVVPTDENIGDHHVEWRFKLTVSSQYETAEDEFYVAASVPVGQPNYCEVSDLRREGFAESQYTTARIMMLCRMATQYIDKMTGRWFNPRVFTATNRFKADGRGIKTLYLDIPIIRLDALYIETQGTISPSLTQVDLNEIRAYNRHMTGQTQPDDREAPRIGFVDGGRIREMVSSGLFPAPRVFPSGFQTVHLEGVFGYKDTDGSPYGKTPDLIRRAAVLLVERELKLDSQGCDKFNDKVKYRIASDSEGRTSVSLQPLWLKGQFTGDAEIDSILTAYARPPIISAV